MIGYASTNEYQKDMCLKEIGLRAQNILTILNLIINMIGGTYTTTEWAHIFTLTMDKLFNPTLKIMRKVAPRSKWIC